jgi:hypothetical protein
MSSEALESYVRGALRLHGYALNEASVAEVTLQFERIAAIAQTLMELPLPLEAGPAGVLRP